PTSGSTACRRKSSASGPSSCAAPSPRGSTPGAAPRRESQSSWPSTWRARSCSTSPVARACSGANLGAHRAEERELHPVGSTNADIQIAPRCLYRTAETFGAGSGQRLAERGRVVDRESQPHWIRDPPPHLGVVDQGRLARVDELEGGPAGVEEHDLSVFAAPVLDLLQPERVAVERERLLVVIDREDHAELLHCHGRSSTRR